MTVVYETVSADGGIAERAKEIRKGKLTAGGGFIEKICASKGFDLLSSRDLYRDLTEAALEKFRSNLPGIKRPASIEIILGLIKRYYNKAWQDFSDDTEEEYRVRRNTKGFSKYMAKYAESQAKKYYSEATDAFMTDLISIVPKNRVQ